MKRYHVIKASRSYKGQGYIGGSSEWVLQEFDTLEEAEQAVIILTEKNKVGWIIVDSQNKDYLDFQSPYYAVEITNNAEKAYIMEWLEAQGIDSSKLEGLFKFPMLVFTASGGWMTEYENVETTSSFREFINYIAK